MGIRLLTISLLTITYAPLSMDVCSTEDIEVATEILNITPDIAMTTDYDVSLGRPTAQSTPVDIDEADLLDEDENVDRALSLMRLINASTSDAIYYELMHFSQKLTRDSTWNITQHN